MKGSWKYVPFYAKIGNSPFLLPKKCQQKQAGQVRLQINTIDFFRFH